MQTTVMTVPDPADPAGFDNLLESVDAAARAGFGRFWLPQLPPVPGLAAWDALTALAVAGARTPGIELATGVVVAQTQHPLVLARQALTTAAATGGRLILGIGVSHRWVISDIFGYDFSAPAGYLREYLRVLIPALAGEAVDHHGTRITAVGQLTPVKTGAPPIIAAALGPRMLRLAGELTDGTVTTWTGPRGLAEHIIPTITQAARAAGRPAPQVIAGLPVSVTSDVDGTREQLAQTFAMAGEAPAYRAVLDLDGAQSAADISIVGTEEQVLAHLRRFADIGVTEFTAFPFGDAATQARTTELLAANRDAFA